MLTKLVRWSSCLQWLFQYGSSPMVRMAKCVRRIIEFHIMLRTPAKLLLLGSYDIVLLAPCASVCSHIPYLAN